MKKIMMYISEIREYIFLLSFLIVLLLTTHSQSIFATSIPENPLLSTNAHTSFLFNKISMLRDNVVTIAQAHYPLFEPATLRSKLPEHTVAYMRIPSVWGILAAPKETFLKQAFENEIHQQQIKQIESVIYHNLLQKMDFVTRLSFSVLLHHARSPAEFALFLPEADAPPMTISSLFSIKLDFVQIADVNALLQAIIAQVPELQLTEPLSDNGFGMIATAVFPLFLHYDVNTHLFTVMSGATVNNTLFQQILTQTTTSQMYVMEEQIDAGKQGFFAWFNTKKLLSFLQAEIPSEQKQWLEKWGLLNIHSVGFGWGSANGKGRLKLMIDAPKAGYRELFPDINNQLNLTTAGNPDSVLLFSLPALSLLQGFEKILSQEFSSEKTESYLKFKSNFQKTTGFSVEDFLQFFGQEVVFFSDELGEFIAIQVNQAKDLTPLLTFIEKQGGKHEVRHIDEQDYHHLTIHINIPQNEFSHEINGLATTLMNENNIHLYWVEESGYLIFAKVPQLLLERHATLQRVNLQQWLAQEQRQQTQSALLLFSMSVANSPRYFYYIYLNILNYLADIAHTEIDMFALPTVRQLNLPANGSYGAQVDMSGSQIALELIFDNSPLDFALNSTGGVAVLGIMAAVAIPAYVDYLNRAKVMEALNSLSLLKIPSLEFYANEGKFPTIEELGTPISSKYLGSIVSEVPFTYTGTFSSSAGDQLVGKIISISFDATDQTWHCVTTVAQAYIKPEICQAIVK